jgi:hypothetical protein
VRAWLLMILTSIFSEAIIAQDYPRKELNPANLADEIFAKQDLDINYQDLYENYLQLISNPLDLNSVTEEQLRSLYILSQEQIEKILNFKREAGPFLSIYELQTIFDHDTFLKIAPFATVPDAAGFLNKTIIKRIADEQNNYLLFRWGKTLEQQQGYSERATPSNRYAGSPDDFYARFRSSRAGDFSLGFTMKKDAGEAITWNPSKKQLGFDYLSFHLQALNKSKIKNLIIGDYQAQFGQGIALGSVFGIGKNGEAVTAMRRANLGFTPYTSIYEAGYFRGPAISYSVGKNITLHFLASLRGRDGSIKQDTTNATAGYLSSFSYTGLHRTSSEITNHNSITESNVAGVIQFKKKSVDAGVIFHHTQFSTPLLRSPSSYNQFYFNGEANCNVSTYVNYSFGNCAFFSEFAQTINNGRAGVAGVLASLTPKLDVSLLYRRFDKNFYSFYSNAIAENSVPQNEIGNYWGWKYSLNKKISLAGYVDLFSFPWLKFRSYSPSDGNEWLLRFNYRPSKTVSFFLQAREESKQRNTGLDHNLYLKENGIKRSYWINCDYAANARVTFRTRAQFSSYSIAGTTTHGMMLLQDVTYVFDRFSISGRYALFDTDDDDNRLYAYERDAWLSFTFPPYYGKGIRNYLLLQCRVSRKMDLWLRWAQTRYIDREIIGSGGETIAGDTRNDVKLQARIQF